MQSLFQSFDESASRRQLARTKRTYGAIYGVITGFAFAFAAWGLDDYGLSQAHALYPWLKFMIGAAICFPLGGLAGWSSAWLDKIFASVLIWLATSAILVWLTVALPFQIAPNVTIWLKPDLKGLLNYPFFQDFQIRFSVGFAWAFIFGFLVGLLQLVMSESAVFSPSFFNKLLPVIVSVILMTIAGTMLDNLGNEPLRGAIASVNSVIQYELDHQGQTIDTQTARQMHLSAISNLDGLIHRPRELVVSSYDSSLEEVHVMVEFGNTLVDCVTVYDQPSFCEQITTPKH